MAAPLMLRPLNLTLSLAILLAGQLSQAAPPDPRFGAVEAYQAPDLAADAGVGWDRLIVHWSQRQPDGPDQWIVPPEETAAIDQAQAAGREVVILLMGTPAWATDGPAQGGVPRGLDLPADDPGNLWAVFVRRIVSEYNGKVRHWIIWNEPDIMAPAFGVQFDGSVEDYYHLLKTAYLAAHAAQPDSVIHLAGLTYWHDIVYNRPPYLQRLLDVATRDPGAGIHRYYFDVLTAHIYFRSETIPDIITFYQRILRRYGLRTPIWLNETNAPPDDDPQFPSSPLMAVTMRQQADFIVQATALALGLGVERIAIYKFADDQPINGQQSGEPYGLFRADGSLRPAGQAFETVTRLFARARMVGFATTAGYYLVTLQRSDALIRVAWARGQRAVSLRLRAAVASGAVYDALGASQAVLPSRGYYTLSLPAADCSGKDGCVVGGSPLILVENLSRP